MHILKQTGWKMLALAKDFDHGGGHLYKPLGAGE